MLSDLYFTHIKIQANVKNALVCKCWNTHLKFKLREKKVQYYDTKIYELIISKLYSNHRIYTQKYYDILLHELMKTIANENTIKAIIKKNMIEYKKTFELFHDKYHSVGCCNIELHIAAEYQKLLDDYDAST
jgi:hypothetical protein